MRFHLVQNHPDAHCQRIGLFLEKLVTYICSLQPVLCRSERPACNRSSSGNDIVMIQSARTHISSKHSHAQKACNTHIRDGKTFCEDILRYPHGDKHHGGHCDGMKIMLVWPNLRPAQCTPATANHESRPNAQSSASVAKESRRGLHRVLPMHSTEFSP